MIDRFTAEDQLLPPLLAWLRDTRRLRIGSEVFEQVAWFGRKIDLVTVSSTRNVVAYELKLNSFRRAVEQATYNRMSFDRTYVVTAARPTCVSLELALNGGVGVLTVGRAGITEIVPSPKIRAAREVRRRLLSTIHEARGNVRSAIPTLS